MRQKRLCLLSAQLGGCGGTEPPYQMGGGAKIKLTKDSCIRSQGRGPCRQGSSVLGQSMARELCSPTPCSKHGKKLVWAAVKQLGWGGGSSPFMKTQTSPPEMWCMGVCVAWGLPTPLPQSLDSCSQGLWHRAALPGFLSCQELAQGWSGHASAWHTAPMVQG